MTAPASRSRRGTYALLAAALVVIGAAAAMRYQRPIYAQVYARRLAAPELDAETAIRLARELAAVDPAEEALEGAGPAARVRYRIVHGFEFRDVVKRFAREAKKEQELTGAVESAEARAAALRVDLARQIAAEEGRRAAEGLLAGGGADRDVRKRAATALGLGGAAAGPALRRAFADASVEVATYAFEAFLQATAGADAAVARLAGLAEALGRAELRGRALGALGRERGKPAARVVIAAIEKGELEGALRLKAFAALEASGGPADLGSDLAAWKAWAETP